MCGPSGAGKSTLIGALRKEFPDDFGFSVSHTTREPRTGERDGVDYNFVRKADMEAEIAAGKFLEHANVHGNLYGTSFAAVERVAADGRVCILDIDVQVRGARAGKEAVRRGVRRGEAKAARRTYVSVRAASTQPVFPIRRLRRRTSVARAAGR